LYVDGPSRQREGPFCFLREEAASSALLQLDGMERNAIVVRSAREQTRQERGTQAARLDVSRAALPHQEARHRVTAVITLSLAAENR
jgi:hypothetical protein